MSGDVHAALNVAGGPRTRTRPLGQGFAGEIILPGDAEYDRRRRVWNGIVDRRPALIARCANAKDVAAAVRFGRMTGLEIGVRCGGHSVMGLSVPEGGLMIDLTEMSDVRVDAEGRRAWVQGGALLRNLDRATQPEGLATTAGNVSHTGVGGLTLGGGMGWLARQLGLACDNVTTCTVVTADGHALQASASENADLFWALRGGGGNFGIVTEFTFRLHPIRGTALVVDFFHTPDAGPSVVRGWRDLLHSAPRQATLTAWAGTSGNWEFLEPHLRTQPLTAVGYVWVGDLDEGRRVCSTFRSLGNPVAERIEQLSYVGLQSMDDEGQQAGLRRYWKGHYLSDLSDQAIDAFLSRGITSHDAVHDWSVLPNGSLQAYGGAIGDVEVDETAFSQRGALVEFLAASRWHDPADDEAMIAAARAYGAAVAPFATGAYVNALTDEGQDGVRRAYPAGNLAKLAAIKQRYDPDNVFHFNHNIRPAPDASA